MSNERWSTASEIKKSLTAHTDTSAGGPVLFAQNGRYWKHTGEGHTIFVGASGGGKSRRGTIPMTMAIIKAQESFICADPKGEIYAQTAHMLSPEYKKIVIDFRHVFDSPCCNVLSPIVELYRSANDEDMQVAMELLDHVACALYPVAERDPFWDQSARSVFRAAVCALMDYAKPEQVTVANAFHLITKGDERFGGPGNTYLKEFVGMIPPDSTTAMELHSYVSTAEETRAGVRSTFLQGLTPFVRNKGVLSMMSADDLHINQLDGETPTAIYIIMPDESSVYDSLVGILVNELLTHYVRMAHDRYGGRLPRRLNVILEEFGNIGNAIVNLPHLMSAGRSRNIRCHLVVQTFAQFTDLFGAAKATTIRENAGVLVCYRTTHWDTLAELSRLCGEREIDVNGQRVQKSLISPADLSAMQVGQVMVMISGGLKFISWLPDFTELFQCDNAEPPKPARRSPRALPEIFDIREVVKEAKRKKMEAMMEGKSSESILLSPFGLRGTTAPPFDVEELISKIDAKIAELDADKNAAKPKPYTVTLVGFSGKATDIVRAIRKELGLGPSEAVKLTKSLPSKVHFEGAEEARSFAQALKKAGGIVTTEGFKL